MNSIRPRGLLDLAFTAAVQTHFDIKPGVCLLMMIAGRERPYFF